MTMTSGRRDAAPMPGASTDWITSLTSLKLEREVKWTMTGGAEGGALVAGVSPITRATCGDERGRWLLASDGRFPLLPKCNG